MVDIKYVVKVEYKGFEKSKVKDTIKDVISTKIVNLNNEDEFCESLINSYKFIGKHEEIPSISQIYNQIVYLCDFELNEKVEELINTVYNTVEIGYYPEFTINNDINERFSSKGDYEKDKYLLKRYIQKHQNDYLIEFQNIFNEKNVPEILTEKGLVFIDDKNKIINSPVVEVW